MTPTYDPLARLRQQRAAHLQVVAGGHQQQEAHTRACREIGFRLALQYLTWAEVESLRRALSAAYTFKEESFYLYGGPNLVALFTRSLPEDPRIESFAAWVAFLEGVHSAALTVEGVPLVAIS